MTGRQQATESMLYSIVSEASIHTGKFYPVVLLGFGMRLALADSGHAREFADEIQDYLVAQGLGDGLPSAEDMGLIARSGRAVYEDFE